MKCTNCGTVSNGVPVCPTCGARMLTSSKSRTAATLLCFFLGSFGIHRFYTGKVGTGILWLFTLGLFGIGTLVDFIMIVCGAFKDKNGWTVSNW